LVSFRLGDHADELSSKRLGHRFLILTKASFAGRPGVDIRNGRRELMTFLNLGDVKDTNFELVTFCVSSAGAKR